MQTTVETRRDGSVAILVDREAARATVASLAFAARFHGAFVYLAELAEAGLRNADGAPKWRSLCQ